MDMENHNEALCPKCDSEFLDASEFAGISLVPDLSGTTWNGSDEFVLFTAKCEDCDYEGYALYPLGHFKGFATEAELELMGHVDEARYVAQLKGWRDGELCFLGHRIEECTCGEEE